jgi:hypothetical protein
LTGLAYFASAYVGRRLPCGYFWIGFLSRNNRLFRIGVFSELTRDGRQPKSGFTFDVFWFGTTKNVLFIQYFGPPPEQLQLGYFPPADVEESESSTSGIEPQADQPPVDEDRTPLRNALMLLACVSIYFLPHSRNTDQCTHLCLVSRSVCIFIILPSFAQI